ncbi:MAG: HlyD family type I secretion periplasmic adaptor subunit [Alphaproteobacteria bacterium]
MMAQTTADAAPARMGIATTLVGGFVLIAVFFGGFGGWAAFAPLESAAIAPGVVSVDSKRKTIQHLEGGIVAAILVREGDAVTAGQPLVRLDDTQARAQLGLVTGQYRSALALEARLEAELDGLAEIAFPGPLLAAAGSAEVDKLLSTQQRLFRTRAESLVNQTNILRQRIAQLREEITGTQAEMAAQDRQLSLVGEELATTEQLLARGYERRPRLLDLQRQQAEITGARAQNKARIARAHQSIGEAELQITQVSTDRLNEVVEQLRTTQSELADLSEKMAAANDVLGRTVVLAPVDGTVVSQQVATTGGVIAAGQPLLDIVPADDKLIVEARLEPNDIDVVTLDLPAQVRISAFTQRTAPVLDGKVTYVSADRLTDERSGVPYYLVRVVLTPGQPGLRDLVLQPGMAAEVLIVTGKRTPLDYLVRPIMASFGRALHEE